MSLTAPNAPVAHAAPDIEAGEDKRVRLLRAASQEETSSDEMLDANPVADITNEPETQVKQLDRVQYVEVDQLKTLALAKALEGQTNTIGTRETRHGATAPPVRLQRPSMKSVTSVMDHEYEKARQLAREVTVEMHSGTGFVSSLLQELDELVDEVDKATQVQAERVAPYEEWLLSDAGRLELSTNMGKPN